MSHKQNNILHKLEQFDNNYPNIAILIFLQKQNSTRWW